MKKLKNVMLFLACGLVVAAVTTSCKKDEGTPSTAPTIGSLSATTSGTGDEVTITGTNLTGGTIKVNGVTAVTTAVTATSITYIMPAGITVGAGNVVVTTTTGTDTETITIVLSSNGVATDRVVGHWSFDTDNKEAISHAAAAMAIGVAYADAGKIGKCATFTNGYLVYNPIDLISRDTALQSYTISMWVNIPASQDNSTLRSLFQVTGNRFPDLWGNVGFELVNDGTPTANLPLQARQVQVDGLAPYVHNESAGVGLPAGKDKWVFLTLTYDGSGNNQTIKIYADGQIIKTQELTTVDKSVTSTQSTFRVVPTGNAAVPTPTPANKVYIGTLAFYDRGNTGEDGYGNKAPLAADRPWAGGSINGKIDDIRLFNTPLSQADITALLDRGNAGH